MNTNHWRLDQAKKQQHQKKPAHNRTFFEILYNNVIKCMEAHEFKLRIVCGMVWMVLHLYKCIHTSTSTRIRRSFTRTRTHTSDLRSSRVAICDAICVCECPIYPLSNTHHNTNFVRIHTNNWLWSMSEHDRTTHSLCQYSVNGTNMWQLLLTDGVAVVKTIRTNA